MSKEFIELIADLSFTDQEWAKLTAGDPVHFELRLKRPFYTDETLDGEPVSGDTWIIAAAYADKTETGTVKGVLGCLTDISRQKWAEDFQARRTDEAIAALKLGWDKRDPGLTYLQIDPMFDPLRKDPRFQAIVKQLDFPT